MTHRELHDVLADLGWGRQDHASGTVDFSSIGDGPKDLMVRTIPDDPEHAMCIERGGGRVVTSVSEAAKWAKAHGA